MEVYMINISNQINLHHGFDILVNYTHAHWYHLDTRAPHTCTHTHTPHMQAHTHTHTHTHTHHTCKHMYTHAHSHARAHTHHTCKHTHAVTQT